MLALKKKISISVFFFFFSFLIPFLVMSQLLLEGFFSQNHMPSLSCQMGLWPLFPLSGFLTHVTSCCAQNEATASRILTLPLICQLFLADASTNPVFFSEKFGELSLVLIS